MLFFIFLDYFHNIGVNLNEDTLSFSKPFCFVNATQAVATIWAYYSSMYAYDSYTFFIEHRN